MDKENNTVFEPIYSELLNSENAALHQLVPKFIRCIPDYIAKIDSGMKTNNLSALKDVFHAMKGVAGNYGFPQLYEECANAENLCVTMSDELENMVSKIKITTMRIVLSGNEDIS